MIKCPHCQATTRQNKAGKTSAGSQRYRCMYCQRKYTPEPKPRSKPAGIRTNTSASSATLREKDVEKKGSIYAKVESPWLRRIVAHPWGALGSHWVFQGMLYMDPTERYFKVALDLLLWFVFTVLMDIWLPLILAIFFGFLVAHTINFLFNGQVYAVLKHFDLVKTSWQEFDNEVEHLRARIDREKSILFAAAYGSLAREEWSPRSDLDLRLVRAPGWRHGLRVCLFALRERARAFIRGFPLDLFVLDTFSSLKRMSEKKPVILGGSQPDLIDSPVLPDSFLLLVLRKIRYFKLNSLQRLFLFGAGAFWFLAFVALQKRNYQDSWILEGLVLPLILFLTVFFYVLIKEEDNRLVALICTVGVVVLLLIPALKYSQPYGTTIDATEHYVMIKSLVTDGQVAAHHTYASIAGMHAWLASLAITGGLTAEQAIKFGLPIFGGILPLIIYWICKRSSFAPDITKYTIIASCMVIYPSFLPNGTGFTTIPLMMLLALIAIRGHPLTPAREKPLLTILAIMVIAQITQWHSTTPMLIPLILVSLSLTPVVLRTIGANFSRPSLDFNILILGLFAALYFIAYHYIESDRIYHVLVDKVIELATAQESVASSLPKGIFRVTPLDVLRATLVSFGRELSAVGLMGLGVLLIFFTRKRWSHSLYIYAYFFLIFSLFTVLIVVATVNGIPYQRFLLIPVLISPIFMGPMLWWMNNSLFARPLGSRFLGRFSFVTVALLLIVISIIDLFIFQPFIPKAKATAPNASDEYVIWLHQANSAYQQRMMSFAEANAQPRSRFAIDLDGKRQYIRYFGDRVAQKRGLYVPLFKKEPVDVKKASLFLLHWPGKAGGMGEIVEFRSNYKIEELRATPGWGLVYDNGESFILLLK